MFRTSQIINRMELLNHFSEIAIHPEQHPQPILITERLGYHLALVTAETFKEFLQIRLKTDGIKYTDSHLRDVILSPKS